MLIWIQPLSLWVIESFIQQQFTQAFHLRKKHCLLSCCIKVFTLELYCNFLAAVVNFIFLNFFFKWVLVIFFPSFRYEYKLITKKGINTYQLLIFNKNIFCTKEYEMCKFSIADTFKFICRYTPHCSSKRFMSFFISPGLSTEYISTKNRPFFYTAAMASVSWVFNGVDRQFWLTW